MKLFPKETSPYFIISPSYTFKSSGVRTLHLLCHALNESGQKAFLVPDDTTGYAVNPHLNTPLISDYPEYQNFYSNNYFNPIFIYHNLIKGNPLQGSKIVRYLLAPAGAYNGVTTFSDTDNIWGALPSIAENVLRLPVSDTSIFYDDGRPRSGSCFYSHKYDRITKNKLLPITENSKRAEGTLHEVAEILRSSEVCYLYEISSIMTEAALCGCPVVLVSSPQLEYIDPACMMGNVTWDDGVIVKQTGNFLREYRDIVHDFPSQLDNFIKKTQAMP